MRLYTIILTLVSSYCYAQQVYDQLLSLRLEEIKQLSFFNNSVIVFDKSSGYGSTYPFWTSHMDYYEDDMVINKGGKIYQALVDNAGKNPGTSPKEWKLVPWRHPYFFLRDTAKVEDLKQLLNHEHPYIKTYAFGALADKNIDGLFKVILDNLNDTTRITQMTSDYGYDVCHAQLMMSYELDDLTTKEKNELKTLIDTKYKHLADAKQ